MSFDTTLLASVDALYQAALEPQHWPDALSALMTLTGSQAATVWVLDGAHESRLPVFDAVNFDPAFIQEYLAHMAPHDPTVQYLLAHPHEPIVHDGMVIDERAKDRHPYYDWHARHSDTRFRLVGRVPTPGIQAGVALHRRKGRGRYGQADLERFALIHRHLARALTISTRLSSEGDLLRGATDVIARHPAAIVFLDERRHLVHANPASETYRAGYDGVTLTAHGFSLSHKPDDDRLQAGIRRALDDEAIAGRMAAIRVPRISGKRPFTVLVSRLPRHRSPMSRSQPAVLVMVADPERERPIAADVLMSLFGLTRAESALAVRLAAGDDLRTSADTLGITYGTARVRLACVFQKTDTRRQGELVKLLLTILPLL